MRNLKFILPVAAVLFICSCKDSENDYDASGTFEATEIVVSSEVSGKILTLDVQEGETIAAGETVGYIDSVQLWLKKKQLINSVKAVKSRMPEINKQIAVTEQQLTSQKSEKERVERLVRADAAGSKQLDDINNSVAVLERQLEAQKSSLEIASRGISEDAATLQIQIEQIDDQLKKCRIANPLSGTVLVKYTEANELAMPGKALYKIADLENMILKAYITAAQLTQLKIGQSVKIFADFGEESREYQAIVKWISDKAEFTPKTIQTRDERANLVYAIKLSVKNDGFLKIGMYGEVKF
ncbi:MAG: HlyD family efflux transporter periplasmic adaptor subunit [Bacteroidales bacterium]|nr:HlyD family efflux transporter periplasmic adaptor subunit [Bacteroidales bacterium]MDD2426035.1 HlyD family efflux transporter periplasmic adaptor subunit [Bacteroidales bacterium]MDD3990259.1 HlyD family efflux transporter periplasmic adaptor subunit [Bacteroidales bacterium]MDD4639277.1 HlyD family efflux transporter periplasmic adaptor subunit [Bacteroidales bacterium]